MGVLAEIKTGPAIYDPYAGIYSQTFDLCDEIMPRVNGSCPIDAGIQTVVFNINMPNSTVNTAAGLYVNIKGTLWLGVIAYDRTDHSLPCLPPPL